MNMTDFMMRPATPPPQRRTLSADSVAIVIAAMNAEETITRAVASALAQPEAEQVIVVDDGSSDDTQGAAMAADDGSDRLEVIRLDKNRGPAGARNRALQSVRCRWYTMLDADDFLDEGRIGRLLAAGGGRYDIIADDLWLVEEGNECGPRQRMWGQSDTDERAPLTLELFISENVPQPHRKRRELGFLKPLIRVSSMKRLELAYDETMRLSEDYDLYCRLLAARVPALLIGPTGYVAVRRNTSLSARHDHNDLAAFYACAKDHENLPGLSRRERKAMRALRKSISKRYRWAWLIHALKSFDLKQAFSAMMTSPDIQLHLVSKSCALASEKLLKRG